MRDALGAYVEPVERLILGESHAIERVRTIVAKVAPTPLSILIQGPTGAGKELVAQALHAASGRSGAFVPLNVCAITDTMFEDALFGHVRGAFTGALHDHAGYLTEAHRGTVFFDEVGGLPLAGQMKLLRVLETRTFRPVGARADRTSDFRAVAATNEDLAACVRERRFRGDLAYRLGAVVVHVPALRERMEDVPVLAEHFLAQFTRDWERRPQLSRGALSVLRAHAWPGNVRELKHVVQCAAALASGREIAGADVHAGLAPRLADSRTVRMPAAGALLQALEHAGWDVNEAARRLGVHRATLYRRLRQAGIRELDVRVRPATPRVQGGTAGDDPARASSYEPL